VERESATFFRFSISVLNVRFSFVLYLHPLAFTNNSGKNCLGEGQSATGHRVSQSPTHWRESGTGPLPRGHFPTGWRKIVKRLKINSVPTGVKYIQTHGILLALLAPPSHEMKR